MRDRFDQGAELALGMAEELATENRLTDITPECVLLGILRSRHGAVHNVLNQCNVDVEKLCSMIALDKSAETRTHTLLTLDSDSTHALAFAKFEACRLGHRHIGVAHLFLGLFHLDNPSIASAFQSCGLSLDCARGATADQIGSKEKESGL